MADPRFPALLRHLDKVIGFLMPRTKVSSLVPYSRSSFRILVPSSDLTYDSIIKVGDRVLARMYFFHFPCPKKSHVVVCCVPTSQNTCMLPRNLNSCEPAITRITSFPCEGLQKLAKDTSIGGLKKSCFLSLSTAKPCR